MKKMKKEKTYKIYNGEPTITLEYLLDPDEDNDFDFLVLVSKTLDLLLSFIQPLAAELKIISCCHEDRLNIYDSIIENDSFILIDKNIPKNVAPRFSFQKGVVKETDALTSDEIQRWMKEVIDAAKKDTSNDISWYYLQFPATFAECITSNTDNEILLHKKWNKSIRIPIDRIANKIGFVGPTKETGPMPPIYISFGRDSFRLELKIMVAWSLWVEDFESRKLLINSVKQIQKLKWEPFFISDEFF